MKIHIAKHGDSLYSIAQKYDVSVSEITRTNPNIKSDAIEVGMKVRVPSKPKPAGSVVHQHVVQPGDTLWKLSKSWGVPLVDLIKANPQLKNPNALMMGEIVNVPQQGGNKAGGGIEGIVNYGKNLFFGNKTPFSIPPKYNYPMPDYEYGHPNHPQPPAQNPSHSPQKIHPPHSVPQGEGAQQLPVQEGTAPGSFNEGMHYPPSHEGNYFDPPQGPPYSHPLPTHDPGNFQPGVPSSPPDTNAPGYSAPQGGNHYWGIPPLPPLQAYIPDLDVGFGYSAEEFNQYYQGAQAQNPDKNQQEADDNNNNPADDSPREEQGERNSQGMAPMSAQNQAGGCPPFVNPPMPICSFPGVGPAWPSYYPQHTPQMSCHNTLPMYPPSTCYGSGVPSMDMNWNPDYGSMHSNCHGMPMPHQIPAPAYPQMSGWNQVDPFSTGAANPNCTPYMDPYSAQFTTYGAPGMNMPSAPQMNIGYPGTGFSGYLGADMREEEQLRSASEETSKADVKKETMTARQESDPPAKLRSETIRTKKKGSKMSKKKIKKNKTAKEVVLGSRPQKGKFHFKENASRPWMKW